MEKVRLTIAIGTAILIYRRVEITVWQEERDGPFSFEFTLNGETIRCKIKTRALD
jgi:hypothetical protein